MSKLKGPFLSLSGRGSLGKQITLKLRHGLNIAGVKPVPTNPRTEAQQAQRLMFKYCASLWSQLTATEKQAWTSWASRHHMTGHGMFQKLCLAPNPGVYLPLLGGVMQGDIDSDSHRILNLPTPLLNHEPATLARLVSLVKVSSGVPAVRAYKLGDQLIDNDTITVVGLDAQLWDNDDMWGPPQNLLYLWVHTPGVYTITGHVQFSANNIGSRGVGIELNDITTLAWQMVEARQDAPTILSVVTQWRANPGDRLSLLGYQSSGIQLTINAMPFYSPHISASLQSGYE